jgi:hypothetical protein
MTDSVEVFADEVHAFALEYVKMFRKAVQLRILNRRYGIRAKRLTGRTLRVMLENDPRYAVGFNDEGVTLVTPKTVFGRPETVI